MTTYHMAFFNGNSFHILRKKPFTDNIRSYTRDGVECIMAMSGTMYHYYVSGISIPVTKKYMTVSVAVNELVKQFRQVFPAREEPKEVWMLYEHPETGKIIPVRYFILTENEVNSR